MEQPIIIIIIMADNESKYVVAIMPIVLAGLSIIVAPFRNLLGYIIVVCMRRGGEMVFLCSKVFCDGERRQRRYCELVMTRQGLSTACTIVSGSQNGT